MNSTLPLLTDIPATELRGKRVLLRLDLNVPIAGDQVIDDFRIVSSLPTIEYLRQARARTIIVSHLGRKPEESLLPVAKFLERYFPIIFCPKFSEFTWLAADLLEGGVMLLENIRREAGEENNNDNLARILAGAADLYVNDAFASSHRAHASIVGVTHYLPGVAGLRFAEEVKNLAQAFTPPSPAILILGGAKFETKLSLIEKFINIVDKIVVYGALAHGFFKELGYELGESLVDKETALTRPWLHHPKIILPTDVRVKNGNRVFIKMPDTLVVFHNILGIGLVSI